MSGHAISLQEILPLSANCQILQEAAVCQIHQHLGCLQPQHQINQGCQEIPEINRQLYTNGRAANSSHASNVASKPQRSAIVLFNYLSGLRNVCFVPHLSWMSLFYTSHSMYFPDYLLCVKTMLRGPKTKELQPSSWQEAAGTAGKSRGLGHKTGMGVNLGFATYSLWLQPSQRTL